MIKKRILFGLACNSLPPLPSPQMSLSGIRNRLPSTTTAFSRLFSTSLARADFHFDTHHFVQRLEREGLNRAQAEGIMSAMAEVIDESIRNMTSNMVTKAEQEKVRIAYEPAKYNN